MVCRGESKTAKDVDKSVRCKNVGALLLPGVAERVGALPAPVVLAHLGKVTVGRPAQVGERSGGIGVADGRVTGTARREFVRDGVPRGGAERLNDFQNGRAPAGAQVPAEGAGLGLEVAEGGEVAC